jgi:hypothetical protein
LGEEEMSLSSSLASLGIIAILVCCVSVLVWIFLLAPLPYLISAALLKIERRGYWKAFGTAVLGGLAGGIISAIITFIFSAIAGGAGALTLNNINNLPVFMGALLGRLWLGSLLSFIASILIQILIASGLYGVSFGKGALIWLLAVVFSILISIVLGILFVILAAIGILPNVGSISSQIQNMIPGVTF